jgi:hypothetical protein
LNGNLLGGATQHPTIAQKLFGKDAEHEIIILKEKY